MNVTIAYNLLGCTRIAGFARGVTLATRLTPIAEGGYYGREIDVARDAYTAKLSFRVQPGAYFIWGDIRYPGRRSCSAPMGDVVVALPGHAQTIQTEMIEDVIEDDITSALVAGLVDRGIQVAFYTSSAAIPCGSSLDVTKLWSAGVKAEGNAYYASLPGSPSPPNEGKAAAIVRLSEGTRTALILLPVTFPHDIGANSTFFRFDASGEMLDRYASAGTVACLPGRSYRANH